MATSESVEHSQRVRVTFDGGVARVELTRPPHNAIDRALAEELLGSVRRVRDAADVRAVLVSADGRSFSVGGDLAFLRAAGPGMPTVLDDMIARYHEALAILAELPVPVVCAVQGAVAGGALGMLWAADTVIAADNLVLTTAFAAIGASGDGGSSWYLPRLIGLRRAVDLLYSGRTLDAAEALDLGLISAVVPLAELEQRSNAEARRLAAGPTRAFGAIRQLYRESFSHGLRGQLALEQTQLVATLGSEDGRAGMDAFAERRSPAFNGH